MMAHIQYTMQIIMSFPYDIHGFYNVAQGLLFPPRESSEVLDREAVIVDPMNPKELGKDFKGRIEFKDVFFRYPGWEEWF